MKEPDQLINERRVAEIFGVAVGTIQNWRSAGIGPRWVKVGNKAVRYRTSDLTAWLDAQPSGGGKSLQENR